MEARRKNQIALLILSSLLAASAAAAEKVQIRGSTSIEVPKPKHSLEELRNMKVPDGPSGRDEYQGGMAASAPVYTTTPQANKKLKELLDKKENWIFKNPYESHFDSKTEDFMKGEKSTGLYDHPLMQEEEKSLMEEYIEEGKPQRGPGNEFSDADSDDPREEREELRADRQEQVKTFSPFSPERNGQSPLFEPKGPSLFNEPGLFERKPAGSFRETGLSSSLDNKLSREEIRVERKARDAEIVRMLQPRSTAPETGSSFNPIGRTLDSMRQDSTPNVLGSVGTLGAPGAQRTPGAINFGRSEAAPGIRNGPIFTGSAPISSPARSGFDFGTRASASGPSSIAPIAPPAPIATPAVSPTPFVLPFPKRKF